MNEKLKNNLGSFREGLKKFPKKLGISLLVALVAAAAVIAVYLNTRPYAVLFTELSQEDAASIMAFLDEQGATDYRLENNDTILVPKAQEYNLKAKLLMAGYPKSGFSYSTYYDHVGALSTESERNTAYLLTVQERMQATIRCFEGVKDATVNITQGEDRSYVLDSGNVVSAKAGVMVTMRGGQKMSSQMVSAIRNFVAHSVEGLEIGAVSISDSLGNVYSGGSDAASGESSQLKLRLEEENNNKIRTEIMNVLAPLFGEENVRVSVNTNVEISRSIENSTDVYLPEGAADGEGIKGSEVYDHTVIRDGEATTGGVVGAGSNADIPTYVESGLQPDGTEQQIHVGGQVDYDNSRKETQMERPPVGYITDCTVAVSINSTTAGDVNMAVIRTHVARAARIENDQAAEKISILSMPFYKTPEVALPISDDFSVPMWAVYAAGGGFLLLIFLLIVILLIRRKIRKKRKAKQEKLEAAAAPVQVQVAAPQEPVGADVMTMRTERSMELRKGIRKFADENPEIAAQMVKAWLRGGEDND